jgi:ATPase subunit of ABC transporter with duplicated ATPase domains
MKCRIRSCSRKGVNGGSTRIASIIMPCPLLMDNKKYGHGLLKKTRVRPHVLNSDLTVIEQLQQDFPQDGLGALRNLAGAFQFSGEDVDKKIRALSGGEKSRLAIARMLHNPPNLLVLDEPTNHLDLATKEMLVDALKDFEGTMIFVSHDRMFLRGLGSRVLELGGESGTDRNPTVYPGSYVEYVQKLGHEAPGIYS